MVRTARAWALGLVLAAAALASSGCDHGTRSAPAAPERPFAGIAVEAAALGGEAAVLDVLGAQRGEWQASRGGEVRLRKAADAAEAKTADVIIFPGDRLGDLIDAGALAVLPEATVRPAAEKAGAGADADALRFDEVVPAYRDEVSRYGETRVALPLGGSVLVLAYRRDAFTSEANRAAAESAGVALEPPKTWAQLDALAKFFHGRDWDGDGQPESGVALAWGADPEGTGDAILLARAASLALRPDVYSFEFDAETMEPRIGSPPFVEALEAMAALAKLGPDGAADLDAEAARKAYRGGRVALLIDRAERSTGWIDPKSPIATAVAALPGSDRVYDPARGGWENLSAPNRPAYLPRGGGWLVGVSAGSNGPRVAAATDLARYLASPDTTGRLLADRSWPLLPCRPSQVGQGPPDLRSTPGLDGPSWAAAVGQTLAAPRVLPGLRIAAAEQYLAALAEARVAAVARGEPAESALKKAAEGWSEITARHGVRRQRWHYRRSLNRYPNQIRGPIEPPPREGPM